MSWGPITRVPCVESSPNKAAAVHDRRIAGGENAASSFASFLIRAENSPLHADVGGPQSSQLSKEKLLQLLEKKQMEMNLRLLKSLDEQEESPEPADTLGMLVSLKGFSERGKIAESTPEGTPVVEKVIKEATGSEASKYQHQVLKYDGSPSRNELSAIIRQASETYGVDQDLIRAVIKAESNFQVKSISPKGAKGLMQLMPETAREMGVTDPYDPVENIMGGTRYLKGLLNRYQGNVPRALAAYNWGAGNVERSPHRLPRETRQYIARVTEEYQSSKV